MNPLIYIRGCISESNVIDARKQYGLPDKYALTVEVLDYLSLVDLEEQIRRYKENLELNRDPYDDHVYSRDHRDEQIIQGGRVNFESIHAPKLTGELAEIENDLVLYGRTVKVVGDLRAHKDGNLFLALVAIDPV